MITEIISCVNNYANDQSKQLIATIDPENIRTVKALKKFGIERNSGSPMKKARHLKYGSNRIE
ncbi:MAG: hypothetical protein M3P82_04050 [Bacteroidota bacterium]|nr:hypothetical protein [Bacteroidota bacterium]